MLKRILLIVLTLAYLPIGFGIGIIRGIVAAFRGKVVPLGEVTRKAAFFLGPQICAIAERYENKYAVVTWESLAYAIGVGEEIAGRPVLNEEFKEYLLGVFGKDYEMRIDRLLYSVEEAYGPGALRKIRINMKTIAKDDVRSGMLRCGNFLLTNAKLYHDDMEAKIAQMAAAG